MMDLRMFDDYGITMNLNRVTFVNCSISNKGSTVMIYSSKTKTVKIESSVFLGNAAIEGGALYCKECFFTVFNTTFDTNVAKHGADFLLLDP